MRVVICGGGVIGASIAYFLTLRGVRPTVVEGTGVACAASGKSGGFLALDWCDGSPLGPLARRRLRLPAQLAPRPRGAPPRRTFRLHAELAARHGGAERWGYRRIDTSAVVASARRDLRG